jgi:hypothetical protein
MAYYIYATREQCYLDALAVKKSKLIELDNSMANLPDSVIADTQILGRTLDMIDDHNGKTNWIYEPKRVCGAEIYYIQTTAKYAQYDDKLTRYLKRIDALPEGW